MKRELIFVAVVAWTLAQCTPVVAQELSGDGRSRETPLALGATGQVGDYTVRVIEVTPDATDRVMSENQFNDPPVPGNVFYITRIEVTYHGSETGTPWIDLSFNVVGNSNLGYSESDASCGVIPDDALDLPELFQGGTTQFNVCWSVPRAEISSLVMYVEPLLSFDGERVWFSLNEVTSVQTTPAEAATPTPASATSARPAVQGPVWVGETQVTWTGSWQFDAASSTSEQAMFTQVDPSTGQLKLATYSEIWDSSVSNRATAIDAFAQAFFQGAGAQSIVWAKEGVLANGGAWKLYTFDVQGIDMTLVVAVDQLTTGGGWTVAALTANTESFTMSLAQAQQDILLNGEPVFLDGIERDMVT